MKCQAIFSLKKNENIVCCNWRSRVKLFPVKGNNWLLRSLILGLVIDFHHHLCPANVIRTLNVSYVIKILITILANSADYKLMIFSYFVLYRKQDLTVHASCLHWRQFALNVKSCFLEKKNKIKQKYFSMYEKFTQHAKR